MYATTISIGRDVDCHLCPTMQALARRYRSTATCRCGQGWTGNHQAVRAGVLLAPMDACEVCNALAEDLAPGESIECPSCKETLTRPALDSVRSAFHRFRNNRSGRLRLLRDSALIAAWDAAANPRAIPLPAAIATTDGDYEPSDSTDVVHVTGTSRGARPESTDRPEWSEGQRSAIMRGGRLRQRLNALIREGLRETARVRAEWQQARDDEWRERAAAAASRGEDAPARVMCPPEIVSDQHRAGAVIEWLAPRARVFLDSLAASERSPVERGISREVARAFVSTEQWERWNPSPPAPLLPPKRRVPPSPPTPPKEPPFASMPDAPGGASWGFIEHRRYVRELLPEYLVAVEEHEAALKRFHDSIANYSAEQSEYARRVARQKIAVEGGTIAAQIAGDDLLDNAEKWWLRGVKGAR